VTYRNLLAFGLADSGQHFDEPWAVDVEWLAALDARELEE
jgi:hypothetical protein